MKIVAPLPDSLTTASHIDRRQLYFPDGGGDLHCDRQRGRNSQSTNAILPVLSVSQDFHLDHS